MKQSVFHWNKNTDTGMLGHHFTKSSGASSFRHVFLSLLPLVTWSLPDSDAASAESWPHRRGGAELLWLPTAGLWGGVLLTCSCCGFANKPLQAVASETGSTPVAFQKSAFMWFWLMTITHLNCFQALNPYVCSHIIFQQSKFLEPGCLCHQLCDCVRGTNNL